jgi:hypothetical protein
MNPNPDQFRVANRRRSCIDFMKNVAGARGVFSRTQNRFSARSIVKFDVPFRARGLMGGFIWRIVSS